MDRREASKICLAPFQKRVILPVLHLHSFIAKFLSMEKKFKKSRKYKRAESQINRKYLYARVVVIKLLLNLSPFAIVHPFLLE